MKWFVFHSIAEYTRSGDDNKTAYSLQERTCTYRPAARRDCRRVSTCTFTPNDVCRPCIRERPHAHASCECINSLSYAVRVLFVNTYRLVLVISTMRVYSLHFKTAYLTYRSTSAPRPPHHDRTYDVQETFDPEKKNRTGGGRCNFMESKG